MLRIPQPLLLKPVSYIDRVRGNARSPDDSHLDTEGITINAGLREHVVQSDAAFGNYSARVQAACDYLALELHYRRQPLAIVDTPEAVEWLDRIGVNAVAVTNWDRSAELLCERMTRASLKIRVFMSQSMMLQWSTYDALASFLRNSSKGWPQAIPFEIVWIPGDGKSRLLDFARRIDEPLGCAVIEDYLRAEGIARVTIAHAAAHMIWLDKTLDRFYRFCGERWWLSKKDIEAMIIRPSGIGVSFYRRDRAERILLDQTREGLVA